MMARQEKYGCQRDCEKFPDTCIQASLYKTMADELVSGGYKAAGYSTVNVDDCYMDKRDPTTNELRADEKRFPGGISALAEYVHAQGLRLGVYQDIGRGTCAGDPGLNVSAVPDAQADTQLARDAHTFASWGVDSIKIECE
jgi:alpha-N-acetylgalactosaminidase|eukprot:COSAG01_NODE_1883_length_8988_cov_67.877264_8_plen_141_part_00